MENTESIRICLLPEQEQQLRLNVVRKLMSENSADGMLLRDSANIYYLCGRVFSGYMYISVQEKYPLYFVRRPNHLTGDTVVMIRKPEDIPAELEHRGFPQPQKSAIEFDTLSYSMAKRLAAIFPTEETAMVNATSIMKRARSIKTPFEQKKLREAGQKHVFVYSRIPKLYQEGMRDIDLQIEIERALRLEGCLGQFRVSGDEMEIFMGNVLTGKNADTPSPYDFAMGGEGLDPSIPVGANGSIIRQGTSVMVDVNGDFNGYMTDMTRCYALGELSDEAMRAHQVSIDICRELAEMGRPGAKAADLYKRAVAIAEEAGLSDYFMGHRSHAGFVGHGVGIEINEMPVLAPRSRDILEEGNVITIEPKFVLPEVGAVGIENTYIVTAEGMVSITNAPQEIISLI